MIQVTGLIIFLVAGLALLACAETGQTVQHQTLGPGGQPYSYDAPAPR